MKFKPAFKYKNLFLTGAGLILLTLFCLHLSEIVGFLKSLFSAIRPFLIGFLIAYILNRPTMLVEKAFSRITLLKKKSVLRIASVALVFLILILMLSGLCYIIFPRLVRNLMAFCARLPEYYQVLADFLTHRFAFNMLFSLPDFNSLIRSGCDYLLTISDRIANAGIGLINRVTAFLTDLSVSFIAGIYLLIFKESLIAGLKKTLFALFPKDPTEHAIDILRDSNRIFANYLYSKLLTTLIVGILTFLGMVILKLPYAPLISVIMAIFNLIPFFGPFLGAIPGVLILLLVDPRYALIFILITLVVQFLDNQFFTPKIIGNSIGMNPFWVLFAIVLGGSIGGICGIFFSVPIFAVLFALLKLFLNKRLTKKGLSTNTADYHTIKVRK